jgi:hypothetical protein
MRPIDELVLATGHIPHASIASFSHILNERVRAIAKRMNLTLFDESALVGESCSQNILQDAIHQNDFTSRLIAEALVRNLSYDIALPLAAAPGTTRTRSGKKRARNRPWQ